MKAVCTLVFGLLSLGVFAGAGQVAWGPAVALAVGGAAGGRVGASLAVRAPGYVRWVVLGMVWVSCIAAALR